MVPLLAGEGRDTVGYNEANSRVSRFMHSPERSATPLVQVAVLGKMLGGGSRLRPSIVGWSTGETPKGRRSPPFFCTLSFWLLSILPFPFSVKDTTLEAALLPLFSLHLFFSLTFSLYCGPREPPPESKYTYTPVRSVRFGWLVNRPSIHRF